MQMQPGMKKEQQDKRVSVYIKTDKYNLAHEKQVTIGDVFSVYGADNQIIKQIKKLRLYSYPDGVQQKSSKKKAVVFSILKVIELIHTIHPDIEVVNLGETDFIVEFIPKEQRPKLLEIAKLVVICVVTFLGSAFTIMAFNNDVSVTGVFERFYGQITGMEKPAVTEIEICYSIGLSVGIMVFFNHFGKKKITMDPTPIQVELRKYEADMADTLIQNASRKGHNQDAGSEEA